MDKEEYDEGIKEVHYHIPLKLINSYNWAKLNYLGRAFLPVLGVYADKKGKARDG